MLMREGWIAQDIVICEEDAITNLTFDVVMITFADEKTLQPFRADVGFDG